MDDTERDELINAASAAFKREQDALLALAEERREKKATKILALALIAALWLTIACIVCMLVW